MKHKDIDDAMAAKERAELYFPAHPRESGRSAPARIVNPVREEGRATRALHGRRRSRRGVDCGSGVPRLLMRNIWQP